MVAIPTTYERKWPTIIIMGISVVDSKITVSTTAGLHTKMQASLSAPGQPVLDVEIKRVVSDTQFYVGSSDTGILDYYKQAALAPYIGGTFSAWEQNRNPMGAEIVLRAVYDEEPAVALRTIMVDEFGQHLNAANPLPITFDGSISVGTVAVALDAYKLVPDNVMAVGTENGTKTGISHVLTIDSTNKLQVKDSAAESSLSNIDGKLNSLGQKDSAHSVPVVLPSDMAALTVTGTVRALPAGLTTAGLVTSVSINNSSWTALPATPLTGGNALSIQNYSGDEIKINYSDSVSGYVGVAIQNASERSYDLSGSVIIYAKSKTGPVTVIVEELA